MSINRYFSPMIHTLKLCGLSPVAGERRSGSYLSCYILLDAIEASRMKYILHPLQRNADSHDQCARGCFALFGDSSVQCTSTQTIAHASPSVFL